MLNRRNLQQGILGAGLFPEFDRAAIGIPEEWRPALRIYSPFDPLMIRVKGLYGFIDHVGNVIIRPRLQDTNGFSEGLAAVCDGGRWGYIDPSGQWAIAPIWENAREFRCGLAPVFTSDGWSLIDSKGQITIPGPFGYAPQFSEGLAAVRVGGLYGYVDTSGRMAIDPIFAAEEVEPGQEWYTASLFSEGYSCIRVPGGLHGFIDRTGRFAIHPTFQEGLNFTEGFAAVRLTAVGWGFIDSSGSLKCAEKRFAEVHSFSEGVAAVSLGECRWGFIDQSGDWIIEPRHEWNWATEFSEGLASVRFRDGGVRYIDRSGRITISSLNWSIGGEFRNGVAPVANDAELLRWGYIDRDGKYVWKPTS